MSFISHDDFRRCVDRYNGNLTARQFRCWDQFLAMAFAQLTHRESLRDIEVCLEVHRSKLFHSGLQGPVKRSTLADANERRDWRIYRDLALGLIEVARPLYADADLGKELSRVAYAFDSTVIDLCLSLFPWARFHKTKGAIKLHTLLDMQSSIPTFIAITNANVGDVTMLDMLPLEPGTFIVMDRGYLDFKRLYRLHQAKTFFVVRAKRTLKFRRLYSSPIDKSTGVRADQVGVLTNIESCERYPEKIRRVSYYSPETRKHFVFLTNNFELQSTEIAALYKSRWRVELFFKWIKQHLRVKKFFGTSENSVKTQIWIAISVYVLVAIIKKSLKLNESLYTILQALSLAMFEKQPILSLFQSDSTDAETIYDPKQLILLDL
jgi:transposase